MRLDTQKFQVPRFLCFPPGKSSVSPLSFAPLPARALHERVLIMRALSGELIIRPRLPEYLSYSSRKFQPVSTAHTRQPPRQPPLNPRLCRSNPRSSPLCRCSGFACISMPLHRRMGCISGRGCRNSGARDPGNFAVKRFSVRAVFCCLLKILLAGIDRSFSFVY